MVRGSFQCFESPDQRQIFYARAVTTAYLYAPSRSLNKPKPYCLPFYTGPVSLAVRRAELARA